MTENEASFILANIDRRVCDDELNDALDMAIKALEQQPCEDCISREAVKETIFIQGSAEKLEIDFAKLLLLQRAIKALPSVTPQPKIGKWIEKTGEEFDAWAECSECGCVNPFEDDFNYCPNCGARMTEIENKEVEE